LPDIFLSYSRDDQTTARLFAEGFEREGLSVWWDADVPPLSVAERFGVVRHCNGPDGQLFCELGGRQPAQ